MSPETIFSVRSALPCWFSARKLIRYSPRGGDVPRMMPLAGSSCERSGQPLGGKADGPLAGGRNAVQERIARAAAVDLRAVDVRRGTGFGVRMVSGRRSARRPRDHDRNATGKNHASFHVDSLGSRHWIGLVRRPMNRMLPGPTGRTSPRRTGYRPGRWRRCRAVLSARRMLRGSW